MPSCCCSSNDDIIAREDNNDNNVSNNNNNSSSSSSSDDSKSNGDGDAVVLDKSAVSISSNDDKGEQPQQQQQQHLSPSALPQLHWRARARNPCSVAATAAVLPVSLAAARVRVAVPLPQPPPPLTPRPLSCSRRGSLVVIGNNNSSGSCDAAVGRACRAFVLPRSSSPPAVRARSMGAPLSLCGSSSSSNTTSDSVDYVRRSIAPHRQQQQRCAQSDACRNKLAASADTRVTTTVAAATAAAQHNDDDGGKTAATVTAARASSSSSRNNNNKGGGDADAVADAKVATGALPASCVTERWTYTPPPNNQRTFFFAEDQLELSSAFDSGNLIHAERVGTMRYALYTAMDCGNSPAQTNNRQWLHFRLRGGCKGAVVSFTVVGLMYAAMYTYEWTPVAAVLPWQPQYVRLPGKATVVSHDTMPPTPGYPALVYKPPAAATTTTTALDEDDEVDDEEGKEARRSGSISSKATTTTTTTTRTRRRDVAMSVSFDVRIEHDLPLDTCTTTAATDAAAAATTASGVECGAGASDVMPAMYIASNHPYSYGTLQRALQQWQATVQAANGTAATTTATATTTTTAAAAAATSSCTSAADDKSAGNNDNKGDDSHRICYYHEVLCTTLDGRNVDMLTITDAAGMLAHTRAPMLDADDDVAGDKDCVTVPSSSSSATLQLPQQQQTQTQPTPLPCSGAQARPPCFADKAFVVLTARVHAGECAGSHMMHGVVNFLLDAHDARARALRRRYVFVLVPMLNPDGVVRGHSRVDAAGADLNRMYRQPSRQRHAAPYAVRALLRSLQTHPAYNNNNSDSTTSSLPPSSSSCSRVALYVDMHAHANKRGTFLYGNCMPAEALVQSLTYAKLVSLHTPYFDFTSCSFTEANMYGVARAATTTTTTTSAAAAAAAAGSATTTTTTTGKSKDSSGRVAFYLDAGLAPHCYAIEASHTAGRINSSSSSSGSNAVTAAAMTTMTGDASVLVRGGAVLYSPTTFADTGRALLLALYDLGSSNSSSNGTTDAHTPSRALLLSPYRSVKGLSAWVQRQVQLETAERRFVQAYKNHYTTASSHTAAATRGGAAVAGAVKSAAETTTTTAAALSALLSRYRRFMTLNDNNSSSSMSASGNYISDVSSSSSNNNNNVAIVSGYVTDLAAVLSCMPADAIEDKVTLRKARALPPLSYTHARTFVPPVVALSVLAQAPATSAPRSLFANYHHHHGNSSSGGGGGSSCGAAVAAHMLPCATPSHDGGSGVVVVRRTRTCSAVSTSTRGGRTTRCVSESPPHVATTTATRASHSLWCAPTTTATAAATLSASTTVTSSRRVSLSATAMSSSTATGVAAPSADTTSQRTSENA